MRERPQRCRLAAGGVRLMTWGTAVVAAMAGLTPARGRAQGVNASCSSAALNFQDACQKTIDIFDYLSPQLMTAITGGNAMIGESSTMGLGHLSVGLRATAVNGDVPAANKIVINTTGAVSDSFPVRRFPVPMASGELAVGLLQGLPFGTTHVLGLDALVTAIFIPSFSSSNVAIRPRSSVKLGWGGRIGAIQETPVLPGVSITYQARDLPMTTIVAATGSPTFDTLTVANFTVKTQAWRAVIGKHFLFLGLAAGIGSDHADANTGVRAKVGGLSSGSTFLATPHLVVNRRNAFGDLSLDFPVLKFGAEIGQVSGHAIPTYNSFADKAAGASRLYGSAEIRVKI